MHDRPVSHHTTDIHKAAFPAFWHGKPYYSLDAYCKNTYGEKVYKIALNAGLTCPNRDGTLDTRGCIFCSSGGSGDFASSLFSPEEFEAGFQAGKNLLAENIPEAALLPTFRHIPIPTVLSPIWNPFMQEHLQNLMSLAFPSPPDRTVCRKKSFFFWNG